MTDMIDRLGDIAAQAGEQSATRLEASTAAMGARVARAVRRRRITTAALGAVVVAMAGAGALIVPQLLATELPPAAEQRVPLDTSDGLITFSDGSMQVLTQAGALVAVPAAESGSQGFDPLSRDEACAVDITTLRPGWTPAFADAFALVTFARPLLVDDSGYHILPQGQQVTTTNYRDANFAFSMDVDPAIAAHVVMLMNSYIVAPDGKIGVYSSQLESQPAIDYAGNSEFGTYTATATTRTVRTESFCPGEQAAMAAAIHAGVARYQTVTVFLNDGHGHTAPIATHGSWITIVKENS